MSDTTNAERFDRPYDDVLDENGDPIIGPDIFELVAADEADDTGA